MRADLKKIYRYLCVWAAAAVLLTAVLFFGCSRQANADDTQPPDSDIETEPPSEISKFGLVKHTEYINGSDSRNGIKVFILPQFDSTDSAPLQALIAQIAQERFAAAVPNIGSHIAEGSEVNYDITEFLVTKYDGRLFSARVSGTVMIGNAPYLTDFIYTINIAISGGETKELTGAELISDYEKFRNAFCGGMFTLEYGRGDLFQHTNYEDMISQYSSRYGVYPDIYITDDRLVVNIGLVAALGFNAGFSISIDAAGEFVSGVITQISK